MKYESWLQKINGNDECLPRSSSLIHSFPQLVHANSSSSGSGDSSEKNFLEERQDGFSEKISHEHKEMVY
jgi:hypothetical protein